MQHFRDTNNKIYGFDEDQIALGYATNMIEVSDEDIRAIRLAGKSIDQVKKEQMQAIDNAYQNFIQEDIVYMNTTFQADNYSQDMIIKSLIPGTVPVTFAWRDKFNKMVPMSFSDLQNLASAILVRGNDGFMERVRLQEAVMTAKTKNEVLNAVWSI